MTSLLWIGFVLGVLGLLALDLGVTGKRHRALTVGDALAWTAFYVFLALAFNGVVYFMYEGHWLGAGLDDPSMTGQRAAIQFFTAWVLEKSLSLDNIFVIALVFSFFGVKQEEQHRVLFWGIVGALVFRGILILAGTELLKHVAWTSYVFGAVLLFSAVRMLLLRHDNLRPERSALVRLVRHRLPVTDRFEGSKFCVHEGGRKVMTPLLQALLVIEGVDILFAVDSVPAALAVTTDPFLVFTSNIFAVLGLRALYFVLAGYLDRLRYLKVSLVFLLSYVGVKMMLTHVYPIPNLVSLAIVSGILLVGVVASLYAEEHDTAQLVSPLGDDLAELRALSSAHARRVIGWVLASTVLVLALVLLVSPTRHPVLLGSMAAVVALELVWAWRCLARAGSGEGDLHRPAGSH